ncbi:MAG: hypothetical protein EON60_04435 [Alphaproteobacteria bacterium]|nr:MAG: hypothetical protein EON60_04435 [Alphaproteobacteria bacterium]
MNIRTLTAACALTVLPLASAHAGQIENWSQFTLTINSLDELECIAAFHESNDAYAACRAEAHKLQYRAHVAEKFCSSVTEWDAAIRQLSGNVEKPTTNKLEPVFDELERLPDGRIKYSITKYGNKTMMMSAGVMSNRYGPVGFQSGTMDEPTVKERTDCDEALWISTRLARETTVLRGITASRK